MTPQEFIAWRQAAGLSQLKAAIHLQTTVRTISRWENASVPVPKWVPVWIRKEGANARTDSM